MVKKSLYIAWGVMLALCAVLGFAAVQNGPAYGAMIALAVLCFVPPAVIVALSRQERGSRDLKRIRNLAACSLGLTLLTIVGNFLSVTAPEWVGNILYVALVILSTPMVCGQIWIISLLLWAGLMWTCILLLRRNR